MPVSNERVERFRSAIAVFIDERREVKFKGKTPDADLVSNFTYATWLVDASKKMSQVRITTHPLKATFPDAKAPLTTNPWIHTHQLPDRTGVGTHVLHDNYLDVTGNAAILGYADLLTSVEVDGQRLIHWLLNDDSDLISALSDTPQTANELAAGLKAICHPPKRPASHFGAKQIYWCIGTDPANDDHHHLLQPMFSSSLAHAVHTEITDARFGEVNKISRQRRVKDETHDGHYRDYGRQIAIRKLGGTKPQNISQLNSERGGVNYLLPSLPPDWKRNEIPRLLNVDSALDRWKYDPDAKRLMKQLRNFLMTNPDKNEQTRKKRQAIEQALGAELAAYGASVHSALVPGWTRDSACRLPLCEQLWLDPGRTQLPVRHEHQKEDEAFSTAHALGDWPDEVSGRFANCINDQLRKAGLLTVGDAEHRHWARQAIVDAHWPILVQRGKGGAA